MDTIIAVIPYVVSISSVVIGALLKITKSEIATRWMTAILILAGVSGVAASVISDRKTKSMQRENGQMLGSLRQQIEAQKEEMKTIRQKQREEWHDRRSGEDGIRNDLHELAKKPGKRIFTARLGDDLNVDEGVQSAPPKDVSPSPADPRSPQSPIRGR